LRYYKKEWHHHDGTLPNTETNYLIINNLKLLKSTFYATKVNNYFYFHNKNSVFSFLMSLPVNNQQVLNAFFLSRSISGHDEKINSFFDVLY
jgi:hypothetical protein